MEEKKISKTKKMIGGNWITFLLETVFGSVQSMVEGALESVHQAVEVFTRELALRAFVFLFTLAGVLFFLFGTAQFLSAAFHAPGSGGMIVGVFMMLLSLVVYAFKGASQVGR